MYLQMKKGIFNFKMLKDVISIIFVLFGPNFLGDRKLAKIKLLLLRVLVTVNFHFMMRIYFIKNPPRQVIREEEMEENILLPSVAH